MIILKYKTGIKQNIFLKKYIMFALAMSSLLFYLLEIFSLECIFAPYFSF